ncbi:respiratory nitrate reductase subunit gamma [candidate division CSSED10-310 bacterium]|uniref:Respiratory nitrate reductase subunit gamma n=1 Tax=candidate division CSSED10-310 bacterium TaxID=2855610 RepID=A0ABV6YXL5_UNCC1
MLLYLLCYIGVVMVVVGILVRAAKIASLPVHLRWELAPVPHEKGKSHYGGSYFEEFEWWTKKREVSQITAAWYMFQEIFFLKGIWEHQRSLWYFSFPFHQGLYLLFGMTALFFVSAITTLLGGGALVTLFASLAIIVGWVGYLLGTAGTIGLLYKRLTDDKLKSYATFATYFNLVFLAVLFVSGLLAVAFTGSFGVEMTAFWKGIITFNFQASPGALISFHLLISFLFLIYLPFTYMMHFVAKYFTYHSVRWDDDPMEVGSKKEKQVQELLSQPVTWSAKHIGADGKKNWVDLATQEVGKDDK